MGLAVAVVGAVLRYEGLACRSVVVLRRCVEVLVGFPLQREVAWVYRLFLGVANGPANVLLCAFVCEGLLAVGRG